MTTKITPDDFDGLAAKLSELDFTEAEQVILDVILSGAAESDDVAGFDMQAAETVSLGMQDLKTLLRSGFEIQVGTSRFGDTDWHC